MPNPQEAIAYLLTPAKRTPDGKPVKEDQATRQRYIKYMQDLARQDPTAYWKVYEALTADGGGPTQLKAETDGIRHSHGVTQRPQQ